MMSSIRYNTLGTGAVQWVSGRPRLAEPFCATHCGFKSVKITLMMSYNSFKGYIIHKSCIFSFIHTDAGIAKLKRMRSVNFNVLLQESLQHISQLSSKTAGNEIKLYSKQFYWTFGDVEENQTWINVRFRQILLECQLHKCTQSLFMDRHTYWLFVCNVIDYCFPH